MKVLIVDDEESLRISLSDDLKDAGFEVNSTVNPLLAFELFKKNHFEVVVTDLKMNEMDGINFLKIIKEKYSEIFVILITAYGTVQTAVEAMKLGAYDFLTKPFSSDELILILNRIRETITLKKENIKLKKQLSEKHSFFKIIGKSKPMMEIYHLLSIVANSNSSILITGETGTGKEMVADAIHYSSHKKLKPYIKVNCAILSGNLLESELFGHEKGAFSGAINEKKGRFELADGGTIFLDDVDDIPLDLQVKLLRILQDKKFEKVGATTTTQVDVRVIAASKFDLLEKVKKGEFRADLFYRLNVVPITLPPLRKKKEDIPFLIEAFIQKYSERPLEVTKRAMGYLLNYDWPGNVRELENLVERLALTVSNGKIDFNGLPKEILLNEIGIKQTDLNDNSFEQVIQETEISIIKNALVQTVGNKAKAARLLKLKPSTFRSKVEKYKI